MDDDDFIIIFLHYKDVHLRTLTGKSLTECFRLNKSYLVETVGSIRLFFNCSQRKPLEICENSRHAEYFEPESATGRTPSGLPPVLLPVDSMCLYSLLPLKKVVFKP